MVPTVDDSWWIKLLSTKITKNIWDQLGPLHSVPLKLALLIYSSVGIGKIWLPCPGLQTGFLRLRQHIGYLSQAPQLASIEWFPWEWCSCLSPADLAAVWAGQAIQQEMLLIRDNLRAKSLFVLWLNQPSPHTKTKINKPSGDWYWMDIAETSILVSEFSLSTWALKPQASDPCPQPSLPLPWGL